MLSILSEAVFLTPAEASEIRGKPAYLKIELLKFKSPTKSNSQHERKKNALVYYSAAYFIWINVH